MTRKSDEISRRQVLQAGAMAGLGLALPGLGSGTIAESSCEDKVCRRIPSTGEVLPVMGVGTNRFGRAGLETVSTVLSKMYEMGGRVVDTAAMYSGSEEVIGQALKDLGLQDKMFVATKFNAAGAQFRGPRAAPGPGAITAATSFERSLDWLQMERVNLLFAHFVSSVEPLMPLMLDLKQQGRARYIGITSVQRAQHPQVMEYMREYPIDFLQIDYSIGNRDTASDVLPLAAELGIAVMVAVPFGGRGSSLFASIGGREVPDWAAEFGATTWGQFFLKYIISHPAVTCVIPGTTDLEHMIDNQMAGRGALPDEATRRRMELFWDGIR
ncbi:MAG: aldo/keto reductase [Gammaproteobacteria bacterium]|nr:aldo/keto reductase [Gammaproteobacteria bacterium]